MIYRKNPALKHPQQFKLSTLLDFYEANPNEEYLVIANGNRISTVISSSQSYQESDYYSNLQSEVNLQGVDEMAKKTIGLFSNLIKQMKENNHKQQYFVAPSQPTPKRHYEFYYQELKQSDQDSRLNIRGTSTKKVKQRAIGLNKSNKFDQIKMKDKQAENKNCMNAQQPFKFAFKQRKVEPLGQQKSNSNEQKPLVDLDFSFDEINEAMKVKPQQQEKRKQQVEIRIRDLAEIGEKPSQCQEVKRQNYGSAINEEIKRDNFSGNILPLVMSKEIHVSKEILPPIPQQKQEIPHPQSINKLEIPVFKKQDLRVKGAKQAESRIYQQNSKQFNDPKEVQIDFDLDLNFI